MARSNRTLRSNTPAPSLPSAQFTPITSPVTFNAPSTTLATSDIKILPFGNKLPDLTLSELSILRRKQSKMALTASSTFKPLAPGPHVVRVLESSLIFAQHEAGTAVCIDPAGWILTCAHCFGDDEEEYQADSKRRWLLYYTGLAVQVECRAWDSRRDLALLKVITIESRTVDDGMIPAFPFIPLSSSSPSAKTRIFCIGQPGRDDLESTSARRTKYNLIELSEGVYRGMIPGADPQDNSEIGTLMHDAWTYWGHSGAPLLRGTDASLIGLHSSWDDQTAMRHGVPLVAIEQFLQEHLNSVVGSGVSFTAGAMTHVAKRSILANGFGNGANKASSVDKYNSERQIIVID